MKNLLLIVIICICGIVFSQCKREATVEPPEEVDPMTITDSVTIASQNIKFSRYQTQCFGNKISSLNPNEPFIINDTQTYKNYYGCHDGDLPAIDFSKQTLLIANIPRTCLPGFLIEQSTTNNNGHLDWTVKFPPPAGCNDGTFIMRQVCYLYEGLIRKENVTLTIKK